MSSTRQNALRNIAEHDLEARFGDLNPAVKQEWAISLVRQWITDDGYAGLVTMTNCCWFRMIRNPEGTFEVGMERKPARFVAELLSLGVKEADLPALLHQVCILQSAVFETADGRTMQVRILPRLKRVRIEPIADAEE